MFYFQGFATIPGAGLVTAFHTNDNGCILFHTRIRGYHGLAKEWPYNQPLQVSILYLWKGGVRERNSGIEEREKKGETEEKC